ncbi:hypothetical protein V6N12_047806 [Hibiscus sabdariffa]|uniref:Uncharacterized protein n=1 Tax=Hibiscus sabdariffa TaxID=183260 RepID=A0ABR2CU26_9ROSI
MANYTTSSTCTWLTCMQCNIRPFVLKTRPGRHSQQPDKVVIGLAAVVGGQNVATPSHVEVELCVLRGTSAHVFDKGQVSHQR